MFCLCAVCIRQPLLDRMSAGPVQAVLRVCTTVESKLSPQTDSLQALWYTDKDLSEHQKGRLALYLAPCWCRIGMRR
jgi:hypothetical protein